MTDETSMTESSGNVFADLGFENPEEEQLKAQLVREIRGILKSRRLTLARAAKALDLEQADVSALLSGRTENLTLEGLLRSIRKLDRDVSVVVTKSKTTRNSPAVA